eukprot:TRINITY_DN91235_c0_g1_i1.p1 TRINITY_DN91235_c0_g1~~TRINITY_DN91235_c0_g1_i1.p1  ORF type:complete len:247 (-),score=47.88 TRINITY_DN91235_c0_g1_i1:59-751(-)
MARLTARRPAASVVLVALLAAASQTLLCITSFVSAALPRQRERGSAVLRQAAAGRFDAPTDLTAPATGCERSGSGLAWQTLQKGMPGEKRPRRSDSVIVQYVGWTSKGEMFDSSYLRQEETQVKVNQVIPGWEEALTAMDVGEKRRLWIPEALGFSDDQIEDGIGVTGDLVYDVELVKIAEPGIDPYILGFTVAGTILLAGSTYFAMTDVPLEKPEYDTKRLIAFDRPTM